MNNDVSEVQIKGNIHPSDHSESKLIAVIGLLFIFIIIIFCVVACVKGEDFLDEVFFNHKYSTPITQTSEQKFQTEVIDQSPATIDLASNQLDLQLIHSLSLPRGYKLTSSQSNISGSMDKYPEVTYTYSSSDTFLTPEISQINTEEIIFSSIEDDMIYTLTKVEYVDGSNGTILYVNNPTTLNFVACNITQENGMSNLYSFYY